MWDTSVVHWVRIRLGFLMLALYMAVVPPPVAAGEESYSGPYLVGRLLVAAESMLDPQFYQTVILILEHDQSGAFGVVLNRAIGTGPLSDLMAGFDVNPTVVDEAAMFREIDLRLGGPVEPARAMVVHSTDYQQPDSHDVGGDLAWTLESSVLEAAAAGHGPKKLLVFIGYAGWSAGQLEKEIIREDWLDADADTALVFDTPTDELYDAVHDAAGLSL